YLHTADEMSERKQAVVQRFTRTERCRECDGERLKPEARTATVLERVRDTPAVQRNGQLLLDVIDSVLAGKGEIQPAESPPPHTPAPTWPARPRPPLPPPPAAPPVLGWAGHPAIVR
uniref:hypothetical protein n=1 Tax=Nocardia cyriacigeorgica TaxID=135487 RepID=UPI003CC7EC5A